MLEYKYITEPVHFLSRINFYSTLYVPEPDRRQEVKGCFREQQVLQEHTTEDSSSILYNDVPLKQRLRIAAQRKSDTLSLKNSGTRIICYIVFILHIEI